MWELLKIVLLSLMFLGGGTGVQLYAWVDVLSGVNFLYKVGVLAVYLTIVYFTNRKRAPDVLHHG
jgi:hypothetical protein